MRFQFFVAVLCAVLLGSAATVDFKRVDSKTTKKDICVRHQVSTRCDTFRLVVKVAPDEVGSSKLHAVTVVQAKGLKDENAGRTYLRLLKDSAKTVDVDSAMCIFKYVTPVATFHEQKGGYIPLGVKINGVQFILETPNGKRVVKTNSSYKYKSQEKFEAELEDEKSSLSLYGSLLTSENVYRAGSFEAIDFEPCTLEKIEK